MSRSDKITTGLRTFGMKVFSGSGLFSMQMGGTSGSELTRYGNFLTSDEDVFVTSDNEFYNVKL